MRRNPNVILLLLLLSLFFVVFSSACKEPKEERDESDINDRFRQAFGDSEYETEPPEVTGHEDEPVLTAPPTEAPRTARHREAPPSSPEELRRMKERHRAGRSSFPACEQINGPDLANNPELGDHDTGAEIGFVPLPSKGHALDCFDAVRRPGSSHDFLITILDNGGAARTYEQDQIARGFWDGNGKRCNWGREDLEGPDCPVCHPCSTSQGRSAWQCNVKDYQEDLFDGGVNETRIAIQERGAGETYIPTMDCPSRLPNDNGETAYAVYFNQGDGVKKIPGESYIP